MMISQLATVAIRRQRPGLAGDGPAEVRDPLEEQVAVVGQRVLELVELDLGDVRLEVGPEDQPVPAGGRVRALDSAGRRWPGPA